MNRRTLLIVVPLVVVLGNALAYVAFVRPRATPPAEAVAAPAPAPLPKREPPESSPAAAPSSDEATGVARRSAGLVALEAGEYDRALIYFTEAQSLLGERARVADLIKVTQELRSRPVAPAVSSRGRGAWSSRANRSSRARRAAKAAEAGSSETDSPALAPAGGTLIVTTAPRGLLVQVDEAPVDLTPMRVRLKAGTHRVALLDGNRAVYETSLDIKEGATATLMKDLSPEKAVEPARGATSPLAQAHFAPTAAPEPAAPPPPRSTDAYAFAAKQGSPPANASSTAPRAIVQSPSPSPSPSPSAAIEGPRTGSIYVTSPGLYGVVWINGRPRGYPPLNVTDLPIGPAKVEIRVNGVQKRVSSVMVQPALTQSVQLVATKS